MKSCPTCNRTFEDSFTFCLIDGAVLSAPFDPQATKRIPEARITKAPPTEVLPAHREVKRESLPPTVGSPLLPPTLPTPQPYVPLEYSPPNHPQMTVDKVAARQDSFGWIIGGLTIGVMLGIIIGVSTEDPQSALPLGLLGALLGAIIGKLISRTIQKDSE
jgi:predicted lipid-binding transport protein (Tim44 family)